MGGIVFDAIFPRFCLGCGNEGGLLCVVCDGGAQFGALPFAYADPMFRGLLQAWKYHYDREAGEALRRRLLQAIGPVAETLRAEGVELLVPIPLSGIRLRQRGFNQAEEIAKWIGEGAGIPMANALGRRFRWGAQAKRTTDERAQAMARNPFHATINIDGRRIALVDDVVTTGATLEAAADALRAAGASFVTFVTLGKGG